MLQRPIALGLILCQQVIVESRTHNITLVNTFGQVRCRRFPSPPLRYVAYVVMTDGMGEVPIALVVSRLDTLEEVAQRQWPIRFTGPLEVKRLMLRPPGLSFPVPGRYQFSLFAERESIAHTMLQVST